MKLFLCIFSMLFFISTNLFAKTSNLLCKTEWSIEKYPYSYITIEIDFENYVYVFDPNNGVTIYIYDRDKYTSEDIEDIDYASIGSITWNKNFINMSSYNRTSLYELDLINLILSAHKIVFTCELTKRKL